jgi:DNA-binding IclR family transcriptional regulator
VSRAERLAAVMRVLEETRGALVTEEIAERAGTGRKETLRLLRGLKAQGTVCCRDGRRRHWWLRTGSRP